MTRGGKNIIILGFAAVSFSLVATGVSLAIYHNSGDIYLDRSRPGFLPNDGETDDSDSNGAQADAYVYPSGQEVTEELITEYLEALAKKKEALAGRGEAFDAAALSDASLGIE